MSMSHIRNFCIIAHIDHGKSTLADRMMEMTGTVAKREMKSQLLDSMDLEREKGITIKLAPVRMKYEYVPAEANSFSEGSAFPAERDQERQLNQLAVERPEEKDVSEAGAILVDTASGAVGSSQDADTTASLQSAELASLKQSSIGQETVAPTSGFAKAPSSASTNPGVYDLNLIDTPGHVDFSYEVSRSLQACEGAVLVVDASQGIQAQTLANVYLAMGQDLTIIPVLNKVDLPAADVPRVSKQVINLLGCDESEIIHISAKTGENVDKVLGAIVERIKPPVSLLAAEFPDATPADIPTRALIFDSYYDDYRGVILYVRVVDGEIKKGEAIHMMATQANGLALEVGHLSPTMNPDPSLTTGQIGYIVTNLKTTREAKVGDTVTLKKYIAKEVK